MEKPDRKSKRNVAVTVGILALIGALGAAVINIVPSLLRHPQSRPEQQGISITSSSVAGSIVGRDQIINIIVVRTEEDLNRLTARFAPVPRDAVTKVKADLNAAQKIPPLENSPSPPLDDDAVEDIIYRQAEEFLKLGFMFSPDNYQSFVATDGRVAEFEVPVTKGIEYVILALGSRTIGRLREYVSDGVGGLLFSDLKDTGNSAAYSFRATYTGTVVVSLEASKVRAPSMILALVGRRVPEERKESPGEPLEPTFVSPPPP